MNPRWTIYGAAVDDWQDEEMLNDCFADMIDDSLARGPEFLNFLLDGLIVFEDGARVTATDRDPLRYRSNGDTDRKIDFTVADDSKIVGFESKRRDSLKDDQLSDELEKLEYNADGQDIELVTITEHLNEPSIVSEMPDDVHWVSWHALAQRAFDGDALDGDWQPTVSRAKKMFKEFGYSDFNGIDEDEFRVTVWELWKQIETQVPGLETGQRWPYNMLKEVARGSKGWEPIDPDWMMLTFGEDSGNRPSKTGYVVLSNKRSREVFVGLAVHPHSNEYVRNILGDNADALADRVVDEEMEVVQFPLSWLVGRKNLPEGHRKAVTADRPSTRDDLAAAFSDRQGMEHDGANRFVLGYQLSSDDVLEEAVEYLHHLQELFEDDDGPELRRLISEDG
jgi:hypothetical protein